MPKEQQLVAKSKLLSDLRTIGVTASDVIMLHVSVKKIGWIVGGPDIVLDAILDILTSDGTLMMYISWEDSPYITNNWSVEKRKMYEAEAPPFDPARSRACRKWSILTEYLRTRIGAQRSRNPELSCVAVGRHADKLTKDQPYNYGFGANSPLDRLCQLSGKVLLVGAPLSSVSLIHYAESIANIPNKKVIRRREPILRHGKRTWVEIEEFDTDNCACDWPGGDYFEEIVRSYVDEGRAKTGTIGNAQSHLFIANDLVAFAVQWLESHIN